MSPSKYTAIKGVEDILPPDTYIWQEIDKVAKEVFSSYGFQELKPPIIEPTEVFTRSIGETTDIVEKEMYTFLDKAGRSITLRPEGTAGIVRCYIERHLYNLPSPQKFYYSGPMFRYERPQKGRLRQFYQIGVEAFGIEEPRLDAEVITMLMVFLRRLGIPDLSLELNSIGCQRCRPLFTTALIKFFEGRLSSLCLDCRRRYRVNPLRILDCKVSTCTQLRKGAPLIREHLCEECKEHFLELTAFLKMLNLPYILNPEMVRGLDYYMRTTFEVIAKGLGSQNAVAAGGRYDRLVEEFGGPQTPAIGFAIGIERLSMLIKAQGVKSESTTTKSISPDIFIATVGKEAERTAMKLCQSMRAEGIWVELSYEGASLRSQMRKANRLSANFVLIIGADELRAGRIKWKNLKDGSQGEIQIETLTRFIQPLKNKL